jgi:aldehyde dehydrogenase (NAD+)
MYLSSIVNKQKEFFAAGKTKEIAFRVESLKKLQGAIRRYEPDVLKALKQDLNKPEAEAFITEIAILLEETNYALKNLKRWTKAHRVKTPMVLFGAKSWIYPEPYGVALIIAPWNFPFQLSIAPLIGAIAAGNCAIIKPSEYAPHTSKVLAQMIEEIFDEQFVAVVEGGPETVKELLNEPIDKIFFTGSVPVGKSIMEAAAKQLIPVTLELGGKSPTIVHQDADLKLSAKRIVWGKFINAGQTCIAPDYLLVHRSVKDQLIEEMKQWIEKMYGEDPLENPNYTRIINEKHFQRLLNLLSSGKIIHGGKSDSQTWMIAPTLLDDVSWEDPVMQEEIFGPILPILTFEDLDEAIAQINRRPKPLALYVFTESDETAKKVFSSISFGGGCINDTLLHFSSPHLPFGGVGTSGLGRYHGKYSFDSFSHFKSVVKQTTLFDFEFRYPYYKNGLKIIRRFFK